MRIPLSPWRPDQAQFPESLIAPFAADVDGVYHRVDGYSPWREFVPVSAAADGRVLGAGSFLSKTGTAFVFVGSEAKLESLTDTFTFSDYTRSAGAYTTADGERWRMIQSGDQVIATNYTNALQVIDLTSESEFSDLAGSPPRGRYLSTFREGVVIGNTANSEAQLYGSDQGDIEEWSVGTGSSLAWNRTLPDGGPIRGMYETGGALYVFQQSAIQQVLFVGDAGVISVDKLSSTRGVSIPNSFLSLGSNAFFFADDGIKGFNPGSGILDIGEGKIDDWLLENIDVGAESNIAGNVNPFLNQVIWAITTKASEDGFNDYLIFYNYLTGEFGKAPMRVDEFVLGRSVPVSMDSITATMDSIDVSFDSPLYRGGALFFAGFNSDYKYGTFEGDTVAATLESGDCQIAENQAAYLSEVETLDDAPNGTIATSTRTALKDSVSFPRTRDVGDRGKARFTQRGQYWRFRRSIPAGTEWDRVRGLELEWMPAGRRRGVFRPPLRTVILANTEAGDTLSSILDVFSGPAEAGVSLTEGADAISAAAGVINGMSLSATETGDAIQAELTSPAGASLSTTEPGDTIDGALLVGTVAEFSLSLTEGGDTISAATGVRNRLNLSATEGADTIAADADVSNVMSLSYSEPGDTISAAASVVNALTLSVTEASDAISADTDVTGGSSLTTPSQIAALRGLSYLNAMFDDCTLYQEITGAAASTLASENDPVGTIVATDTDGSTVYFTTPYNEFRATRTVDSSGNTCLNWADSSGGFGYTSTYLPPVGINDRTFVMGVDVSLTASNPGVRHLFQYGNADANDAFGMGHKNFGGSNLTTANWGFSYTTTVGPNINSSTEDPNTLVMMYSNSNGIRTWIDGVQGSTGQGTAIGFTGDGSGGADYNLSIGARLDASTTITETAHGNIYGIIVFDDELTPTERASVEAYVNSKMAV